MRTCLQRLFIASLLILSLSSPVMAAEKYQLDPNHSYVLWHVSHFGYSNLSGKWQANGTLQLDKDKPENSKVNITINTADIITGIPKLDKHLKSQDFFDIANFPTATFVSDKVVKTGSDTATVHGILTLKGVSKPIILQVKLNKMGLGPITQKETVGFTADTKLKRSDYGIKMFLPGIGDDVNINIETEAFKASKTDNTSS